MILSGLQKRKTLTVLGLNSGTSVDSLDMAVVRITQNKSIPGVKYITCAEKKFPARLRELVLKIADSETIELDELVYLDNSLGAFYGKEAARYITRLKKSGVNIDLIGSHGQTVRHLPRRFKLGGQTTSGSLQLGSLNAISTATGKLVVGDFRQAAIAMGEEAAPITTDALAMLLGPAKQSRVILNLGGMANYFYFKGGSSNHSAASADCGPGNCLSDMLTGRLFGKAFDRNGKIAASGKSSHRLLTLLLSDPFFKSGIRSTGRETFGKVVADKIESFGRRFKLRKEDLITTVAEFTAASVANRIKPVLKKDKRITCLYLTGGGRKNIFLTKRLSSLLPEIKIVQIEELGVNGDFVEAACFAIMGEQCLREAAGKKTEKKSRLMPIAGIIAQPPRRIA